MSITMTVTNAGLNALRDALRNGDNCQIKYVALGTGTTAPAATDTQLQTEVFRKVLTSDLSGSIGELLPVVYLAPADANGVTVQEVGLFIGASATVAANSGTLLARGLWTYSKDNLHSVQLSFDITI